MKFRIFKIKILLSVFLLLAFGTQNVFGARFWHDSFEGTAPASGGGVRTVSIHANSTDGSGPAVCGSSDYFFRTMTHGLDFANGLNDTFLNKDVDYIWRGEDLDGCIQNPDTITWDNITITGRTNIVVGGYFAARDNTSLTPPVPSTPPFEAGDYIRVSWRIDSDAGAFTDGICFEPTAAASAFLGLDSDCDGTVDGATLNHTLTEYTFAIASTGTTLDIRVTVSVNGGSEEFAMDLFQMGDDSTLPVELQSFKIE